MEPQPKAAEARGTTRSSASGSCLTDRVVASPRWSPSTCHGTGRDAMMVASTTSVLTSIQELDPADRQSPGVEAKLAGAGGVLNPPGGLSLDRPAVKIDIQEQGEMGNEYLTRPREGMRVANQYGPGTSPRPAGATSRGGKEPQGEQEPGGAPGAKPRIKQPALVGAYFFHFQTVLRHSVQ